MRLRLKSIPNPDQKLFSKKLTVVSLAVVVFAASHGAAVALRAVAAPVVSVVPVAFEAMGKNQVLEVGAGFEREILFAANAAVGELLVALRTRSAGNRRIGAAVGTAHDILQVAVAYLCHGVFLLLSVYLGPRGNPMGGEFHCLLYPF